MNTTQKYCLGVDFGTDAVRCLLVNADSGKIMAEADCLYPRWQKGLYCDAQNKVFRQHPLDYIESLIVVVNKVLQGMDADVVSGIGALSIATTGSTPAPVDKSGMPLALLAGFKEDPDAMFYLWKDHSSIKEAEDINRYNASLGAINGIYLEGVGGFYSPEWLWSKWLHLLRSGSDAAKACYSFVEHADWMPFLLTGGKDVKTLKRNICAAGHKGLWSEKWNGFPPESFLKGVDPLLSDCNSRMSSVVYDSAKSAGTISSDWAEKLGLPGDVRIGIGALDAHMGAVGGQIEPYFLSKVMGTSTCDMLVVPAAEFQKKQIIGICGQVPDSIIPGMIGMEAGQSAFGDVYNWFSKFLLAPLGWLGISNDATPESLLNILSEKAASLNLDEWRQLPLSTDWFNGRRSPDVQPLLKAAITGLELATDPVMVFASLVEATCFGSRAIVERFVDSGIPVKGIIGLGGIAHKSSFVMQRMADILNRPIKCNRANQCCALGAAMFAATQAGWYDNIEVAMQQMGQGLLTTYLPNTDAKWRNVIEERYQRYKQLGYFIEQEAAKELAVSLH